MNIQPGIAGPPRGLGLLLFLFLPCPLKCDVKLPAIISDHMVLTKAQAVPLWGKADPGETVTMQLGVSHAQSIAGADGRWSLHIDLENSPPGPFQMTVTGKNILTIQDVVVGTVWLASGQSNMELPLQATLDAEREIAGSANRFLRHFKAGKVSSARPLEDGKGEWVIAGLELSGSFTAAGYYFGKRLQSELQTPVGIVNASWGGTFSEMWMSREAINRSADIQSGEEKRAKLLADYPAKKQEFVRDYTAWLRASGREDKRAADPAAFAAEGASRAGWTPVPLPGKITETLGARFARLWMYPRHSSPPARISR